VRARRFAAHVVFLYTHVFGTRSICRRPCGSARRWRYSCKSSYIHASTWTKSLPRGGRASLVSMHSASNITSDMVFTHNVCISMAVVTISGNLGRRQQPLLSFETRSRSCTVLSSTLPSSARPFLMTKQHMAGARAHSMTLASSACITIMTETPPTHQSINHQHHSASHRISIFTGIPYAA
jgi:hypothetical protein